MDITDIIKSFSVENMMLETELERIELRFGINLGRQGGAVVKSEEYEQTYFPQFDSDLRSEAAKMAKAYELFYCLEKTIRSLITKMLEDRDGDCWWNDKAIPQSVMDEVKKRVRNEQESGITPRSTEELDYTTFGELGDIIRKNWDLFGSVFSNSKALGKVLNNLNSLRNPIAHCCILAEDEVVRLQISLRDWFRLME